MALEIISDVKNTFSEVKDRLGFDRGLPKITPNNGTDLFFPITMRFTNDRPVIRFTAYPRKNTKDNGNVGRNPIRIHLPCPPNLSFSETADFQTFNGGAVFGIANAITAARAEGGNGLAGAAGAIKASIAPLLSSLLPDATEQTANIRAGKIINPNTTNSFRGNGIRSFEFTFKLIARSAKEANEIRKIHSTFRKYLYGDKLASGLSLSYPPVWNIDFMTMNAQTTHNPFIPKIYSCYLTGFNSTFNASADVFHTDGAPLEVDITIQYQETRALNKSDIEGMEKAQEIETRGIIGDRASFFDLEKAQQIEDNKKFNQEMQELTARLDAQGLESELNGRPLPTGALDSNRFGGGDLPA